MQGRNTHARQCHLANQHGLTLVELLVVIGLLATLAGLAAPSFTDFLQRQRLQGYASEMTTNIQYARSEAVARNRNTRLSFDIDAGGTCYLLHTGAAADCTCSSNGGAQCSNPDAVVLKSVGLTAASGVTVSANVTTMLFDPVRGTASPAGSINFTDSSANTIRHIVNIMGRTRTCSPDGAVSGYKPC